MKIAVTLFIVFALFLPNTFAQDYTRWSLPEGVKARLGKGGISAVKYSPDGTRLAVAGSIGIWLYDAHTGAEVNLLTGHTRGVRSVSFSPDGGTLASGSADATIRLWDAATGAHLRTLTGHTGGVLSVSFSPDGRTIASGSRRRYYPSLGRGNGRASTHPHRAYGYCLERIIQSRWRHSRKWELGRDYPSMGRGNGRP